MNLQSSWAGGYTQNKDAGTLTTSGGISIDGDASFAGTLDIMGTLTIGGNLTLDGATLAIDLTGNDRLSVKNTTGFLGSDNALNLTAWKNGTYDLITGIGTANLDDALAMLANATIHLQGEVLAGRQKVEVMKNVDKIQLVTAASNLALTWNGTNGGLWSAATWQDADSNPESFITGDEVVFDGSTSGNVNVGSSVTVSSMLVNGGTTHTYTGGKILGVVQTGEGMSGLANDGKLLITGAGTVAQFANALDFAGGIEVADAANMTLLDGGDLNNKNIALAGNASLTFNRDTNDYAYTGTVSGEGSLQKDGAATVTLSGAQTYKGDTTVNGGTLALTKNASLATNTGDVTINAGGTLALSDSVALGTGDVTLDGGKLTLAGNASIANANSLTVQNGANFDIAGVTNNSKSAVVKSLDGDGTSTINLGANTLNVGLGEFGGVISGSGGVTKTGTGTLTLSGNNAFTGLTTVSGGKLQVGNGGSSGSLTGNVALNTGTELVFNRTTDHTYAGTISGDGLLRKLGKNALTLTGLNTYTGGTFLDAGQLNLGHAKAIGTGDLTMADNTTLRFANNLTFQNRININGDIVIDTQNYRIDMGGELNGADHQVTKMGTGVLSLSNAQLSALRLQEGRLNILGDTELSVGTFSMENGTVLGLTLSDTPGLIGNSVSLNGGTIDLNGYMATPEQLAQNDGYLTIIRSDKDDLHHNMNADDLEQLFTVMGQPLSNPGQQFIFVEDVKHVTNANNDELQVKAMLSWYADENAHGTFFVPDSTGDGSTEFNMGIDLADHTEDLDALPGSGHDGGDWDGTQLTKTGTGTLRLSGNNTYSGGTFIEQGKLVGDTDAIQGDIENHGVLEFDMTGIDGDYDETVTGEGIIAKSGNGTLNLTAENAFAEANSFDILEGNVTSMANQEVKNLNMALGTGLDLGDMNLAIEQGKIAGQVTAATMTKSTANTLSLDVANALQNVATVALQDGTTSASTDQTFNTLHVQTPATMDMAANKLTVQNGLMEGTMNINTLHVAVGDPDAGAFQVDGTLTGDVDVRGHLSGNGKIVGDIIVQSGGKLSPGNSLGQLNPQGDVTFKAGGVFDVEIEDGANDRLAIDGNAFIETGAELDVSVKAAMNEGDSVNYTVMDTTGTIDNEFSIFNDNSIGYEYTQSIVGNNQLVLTVTGKDFDFSDKVDDGNPNEKDVADSLDDTYDDKKSGDLGDLDGGLRGLTDDEVVDAMRQLHGAAHAISQQAASQLQRSFIRNLPSASDRFLTSPADCAVMPCDQVNSTKGRNLWGMVDGDWFNRNTQGSFSGYKINSTGVAVGMDKNWGRNLFLGAAFGYDDADMSYKTLTSNTELEAFRAMLYGGYKKDNWFVDGYLGYTKDWYKTKRYINFGDGGDAFSATAHSKYDDDMLSVGFELGRLYRYGKLAIIPSIGLHSMYSDQPAFTETGARAASLRTDASHYQSLRLPVGFRLSSQHVGKYGLVWSPEFRAYFVREMADDAAVIHSAFAPVPQNKFATTTGPWGRNSGQFGVGLNVQLTNRLDFQVDYDYEIYENTDRGEFSVSVGVHW